MVDFLLVILLSGICTHGWIGLEGGNKGLATIIGVQRSNRDIHYQVDIVCVTVSVRNFKF
jgi:hypothetical protein